MMADCLSNDLTSGLETNETVLNDVNSSNTVLIADLDAY